MTDARVRALGAGDLEDLVSILSRELAREDTTRALLRMDRRGAVAGFGVLQELDARMNLASAAPALGAFREGALVGAAVGGHTEDGDSEGLGARLRRGWTHVRLRPFMREGARTLMAVLAPPDDLPEPYVWLESLVVAREAEGEGVGRTLLEEFHSRGCAEGRARGTYLYTAGARPRAIYERNGFEVVEERRAGAVTVAHMFRAAGQ